MLHRDVHGAAPACFAEFSNNSRTALNRKIRHRRLSGSLTAAWTVTSILYSYVFQRLATQVLPLSRARTKLAARALR